MGDVLFGDVNTGSDREVVAAVVAGGAATAGRGAAYTGVGRSVGTTVRVIAGSRRTRGSREY